MNFNRRPEYDAFEDSFARTNRREENEHRRDDTSSKDANQSRKAHRHDRRERMLHDHNPYR